MSWLGCFLRFLTPTKALNNKGYYETLFYESQYRVAYICGLSTSNETILYKIYSFIVKTMIVLFVLSEFWFLFSQTFNMDLIISNISVTVIHIIAIYRYVMIKSHKNTFEKLSQATESKKFDVSTPQRKELVEFWHRRSEMYLKSLLMIGSGSLVAWFVYPIVDDLKYNLPVAVAVPIDYRDPILYPIVYIVVVLAFDYTSYFVMVNDLIMQVILLQILCRYTVLADCFEHIMDDIEQDADYDTSVTVQDKYSQRLRILVNQHKLIIDDTMELRRILSVPMLFQFAASAMLICCAGYQTATAISLSPIKFLMCVQYLGYSLLELYIFCRWCDEIRVQSGHIATAVYFSGWESYAHSHPGVKRRLMFVMSRASKPVVLSAGGIYELSLESFSTVVKTSYTALTVLLRLRQD